MCVCVGGGGSNFVALSAETIRKLKLDFTIFPESSTAVHTNAHNKEATRKLNTMLLLP